jgi:lysophospholipase L1-like esterase
MLYRWHEYYHQLVCETAREEEADILDIRTPFLLSRRYETLLGEDGIHPTEEGYRLIEETIESQLLVNTHLHSTIQWA